jgi:hypothetical protein
MTAKNKLGLELTQEIPVPPKSSGGNRSVWIVALVIGLVIGLVLGIFVSAFFNLSSPVRTGAGVNNQVQVSGTVSVTQTGTIEFNSLNGTIRTSASITNVGYSVLLVGGQSYTVYVYSSNGPNGYYSLYVPLGVTTFIANF